MTCLVYDERAMIPSETGSCVNKAAGYIYALEDKLVEQRDLADAAS